MHHWDKVLLINQPFSTEEGIKSETRLQKKIFEL